LRPPGLQAARHQFRIDANGAKDDARAKPRCLPASLQSPSANHWIPPARCIEATAPPGAVPVPVALDDRAARWGHPPHPGIGAADAVVLKPMLTGLREALAMLSEASRGGLGTIVTTTFDAGVGTAMAIHLAALIPPPRPACGLATFDRLEHALSLAGTTPVRLSRPRVGFSPKMPLAAAGTRPDPAVSVPSDRSTIPLATATAEPELDPPEISPSQRAFGHTP
jgi:hypothetical protein